MTEYAALSALGKPFTQLPPLHFTRHSELLRASLAGGLPLQQVRESPRVENQVGEEGTNHG